MDSQPVSFRVDRDEFAHAVAWVARSLPTKATQPVLRAMVITAGDEGLELAGFDYEISTRAVLAAEVNQAGRIAVAGKLISEIVSVLPNKPVELEVDDNIVLLTCGSSRFELPIIPLDDYPQLPYLPEATGHVDPSLFEKAVHQVASAAGKDDTLPMLTGIHVEIDGANVTLTATDRFRLAQRTFEWEPVESSVEAKVLVPARSMQDNARTLETSPGEQVQIALGTGDAVGADGLIGLHSKARETTTRLLDAEFPNVAPLLPKHHTSMASIEIGPLQEAIRRVSLVADRNAQIRMEFSAGQVVLSAGGTDSGHAEEILPCAFAGADSLMIAFNPGYLKDGLSVVGTNRVVFGFTEPSRPAILIPEPEQMPEADAEGNFESPETHFTYLLMPVRLPG